MAEDPKEGLFDADSFSKASDAAQAMMMGLDDSASKFDGLSLQLRNLVEVELQTAKSTEDLVRIYRQVADAAKATADTTGRASDKMLAFEYITRPLIDRFVSLTGKADVLSGSLGSLGTVFTMLKETHLALLVSGAKALIDAYDNTIKAHREVVNSQLQSGLSYRGHSDIIEQNRKKLEQSAAAWGMVGEEASKFYAQASGAGIGARPGETGDARAKSVGEDLDAAFKASVAASKAYGISQEETMQSVVQFGNIFGAKGREFSTMMGQMVDVGERSTLGQRRWLDSVRQITDSSKEYAPALLNISILTDAFSKQIKDGTMSLDAIAKLASPAKLGTEALGFVAAMAQEAGKEINGVKLSSLSLTGAMDKIALSGESLNTAMRGGKIDEKEVRTSLSLVTDALRQAVPDIAQKSGVEIQQIMKSIGIDVSIVAATKMFSTGVDEAAKSMIQAGKTSRGEDPAERLAKAGERVFSEFKTSGESWVGATVMFRDAVRSFKETIEGAPSQLGENVSAFSEEMAKKTSRGQGAASAFFGTASDIAMGAMGISYSESPTTPYVQSKMGAAKPSSSGFRAFDTGGFIPEDGNYGLHAGERVMRQGEGGGVSISLGGIQVSVGERGSLRGEMSDALDRLKADVLQQVEDQWNRAALAQ